MLTSTSHDRLILCEGIEDAAFLRAFKEAGRLSSQTMIKAVQDEGGKSGITGFCSALQVVVTRRWFTTIRSVILLADSDTHPGANFTKIKNQIQKANLDPNTRGRFPLPSHANQKAHGTPSLAIVLFPSPSSKGALETVLWNAISGGTSLKSCVENSCDIMGVKLNNQWSQAHIDKAKIRIAIALQNKGNPALGLSKVWKEAPLLIPITHLCFNPIETLFTGL